MFLELKAIQAVAYIHRAIVSGAIRTLNHRNKRMNRKYVRMLEDAKTMDKLAATMQSEAANKRNDAREYVNVTTRQITAAQNVVFNAQDDLNKFSASV